MAVHELNSVIICIVMGKIISSHNSGVRGFRQLTVYKSLI